MEPGGREPAPGGLRLVQAFINTVDIEDGPDLIATPDALHHWLAGQGLPTGERPLADEDVRRARAVREALRTLALTNNGHPLDAAAVTFLDQVGTHAGVRVRFDTAGGVRLEPSDTGLAGALAHILVNVHTAVIDGTWPRLKACRNEACRWVFYDTSKNRSGIWCTMSICGDKLKSRAYRRRHRANA